MKNIIKKLLRESLNYLVEYSTNKEWNEWLKNQSNAHVNRHNVYDNGKGKIEFSLSDKKTYVHAYFDNFTLTILHKPYKNSSRTLRKQEKYNNKEDFIYRLKELVYGNKQFKITDDKTSWIES
jgi:hypothetical protein